MYAVFFCRTQEGPAYIWLLNFYNYVCIVRLHCLFALFVRIIHPHHSFISLDQILVPMYSLRDKWTKGQRGKGTPGKRDKVTKRQRGKGTKRQRDKGTKELRKKSNFGTWELKNLETWEFRNLGTSGDKNKSCNLSMNKKSCNI